MPSDSRSRRADDDPSERHEFHEDPRILLFMRAGRNRELLVETLGEHCQIETTTDVEALDTSFDCCIFDFTGFNRVGGTIQSKRDTSNPVFLPFVLLGDEDSVDAVGPDVWDYVDDVIELPVKKAVLLARIKNLVERRQTSVQLAERESELETTIDDLKLKEQVMDEAPVGITITESGGDDNPVIYANKQFERLTGYSSTIIGSDCRFLQGEETDADTRATIREALNNEEAVSVDILNYRKNGQRFWNKLDIAPIYDGDGAVTNYVGFQSDITERKIKEQRLEVMNRVLDHNLRNKMNVIEGHTQLLRDEFAEDAVPPSLEIIEQTATNLLQLAETARDIEETLSPPPAGTGPSVVAVDEELNRIVNAFADRFPAATIDLTLPSDRPCKVSAKGIERALEEAIENAIKHNDSSHPSVEIDVTERSDEWLDIEIKDDGPGIPNAELQVLREGETPLNHADRLGLWLMYWTLNKAGGHFSITESDGVGTTLTFSLPQQT